MLIKKFLHPFFDLEAFIQIGLKGLNQTGSVEMCGKGSSRMSEQRMVSFLSKDVFLACSPAYVSTGWFNHHTELLFHSFEMPCLFEIGMKLELLS